MNSCVFCRIISGEVPAHKVYEDEKVLAFLDVSPAATGHTLIIPKNHVARIEELPVTDAEALFQSLHKLIKPIRESVGCPAATIGINDGPGSGQEIPHVHIHIIPRHPGDGGSIIQATARTRRPTAQQLQLTAKIIKASIDSVLL